MINKNSGEIILNNALKRLFCNNQNLKKLIDLKIFYYAPHDPLKLTPFMDIKLIITKESHIEEIMVKFNSSTITYEIDTKTIQDGLIIGQLPLVNRTNYEIRKKFLIENQKFFYVDPVRGEILLKNSKDLLERNKTIKFWVITNFLSSKPNSYSR